MDISNLGQLLSDADFGAGFATGIGAGMIAGIAAGNAIGNGISGSTANKLKSRLTQAIESGEVSVVNSEGEKLSADSLLKLLSEEC